MDDAPSGYTVSKEFRQGDNTVRTYATEVTNNYRLDFLRCTSSKACQSMYLPISMEARFG